MTQPPDPPEFDREARQSGRPFYPPPSGGNDSAPPPPPEPPRFSSEPESEAPRFSSEPAPEAPDEPAEQQPVARSRGDADRPFAPVVFDDDDQGGPPPPFAEYDDSGVLRVLGVIVLLAIVIAVLVLPPISILDRGGDDSGDLSVQARGELPELPAGLTAVSQLYDLSVREGLATQSLWTLSIKLNESTDDDRNLAFYTHQDGQWLRIGSADLTSNGSEALAEVSAIPANVAVLRRTAFERSVGLIIDAGEVPDPAALATNPIVAVMAGRLEAGDSDSATLSLDAVDTAAVGGSAVYLGVEVAPEAQAALNQLLSTEPATVAHVGELVAAVREVNADGLYLAYLDVEPDRQPGLTRLVTQLASALNDAGLGLIIGLPAPATADTGAYDWDALGALAGGLWLNAPADPSVYYEQLSQVLDAQQAAGVELDSVSLVIGRQSRIRDSNGVSEIGRSEALGRAAQLEAGVEGGIVIGDLVSLTAINVSEDLGNSGLRWDTPSRAVSFAFAERGGPRTVWVENSYSIAFRLDLARRYELGGVVIADAQADDTLPAIWDQLASYIDSGAVTLLQPYGPYLAPCWQALDGVIEGEAGNCWAGGEVNGVATWRAPATPGAYEVRLVVSDGELFIGRQLILRVTEEEEQPEATPEPTEEATPEATPEPSDTPVPPVDPTEAPTEVPTEQPTVAPTVAPTAQPTTPPPAGTQGPPGPGGNE